MVAALRELGLEAHKLTDHFPQDIVDVELFVEVSDRGWVLLTKDKAMRRRPNERVAILETKIRVFNFSSGNISGPEMIEALLKALPRMVRFIAKHPAPFAARIGRDGTLEELEI
jgi:predicted nuclease of predicted toxin-antitoxin system